MPGTENQAPEKQALPSSHQVCDDPITANKHKDEKAFFMPRFPWYNTIHFRISLALFVLFAIQAGTAGFTLYEVDLRKHDYEILNLAGQTRVISHTMAHEPRLPAHDGRQTRRHPPV
jgi:hypothetical protein